MSASAARSRATLAAEEERVQATPRPPGSTSSTCCTDDLVSSDNVFFVATGITDGELVKASATAAAARPPSHSSCAPLRHDPPRHQPHRLTKLRAYSAIDFDTPASVRVATWNVNSIGARLPRLLPWLEETSPDVVALQETKCADRTFPYLPLQALGYEVAHAGDGRWNGVAVLSRVGLTDVDSPSRGTPSRGWRPRSAGRCT